MGYKPPIMLYCQPVLQVNCIKGKKAVAATFSGLGWLKSEAVLFPHTPRIDSVMLSHS